MKNAKELASQLKTAKETEKMYKDAIEALQDDLFKLEQENRVLREAGYVRESQNQTLSDYFDKLEVC